MSSFRDDAPPWSFFIPITLAVIVGVLAADAIRYAIGTVFGNDDTPRQLEAAPAETPAAAVPEPAAPAPQAELEPEPVPGAGPGLEDGADGTGVGPDAAGQAVPARDETPATSGVLELPDSMTARRDGDPAACVNGTVVNRVAGGWEQALENDAPVSCVIVNR